MLNTPVASSRWSIYVQYAQTWITVRKLIKPSGFVKKSLYVVMKGNMKGLDKAMLKFFMNEMAVELNMLGSFMEYRIGSDVKGSLIVSHKHNWL